MGCDFAMKSCKEIMEKDEKMKKAVSTELYNLHKSPFCTALQDGQGMTLCNHDRSTVGSCNLVQYERSLPKIYQNFASVENVNRRDIRKVQILEKHIKSFIITKIKSPIYQRCNIGTI